MSVSIEAYILINLVMNSGIVAIVARSRGRVVWWRVAFAAAFASVYALAMESGWFPQLNYLAFKLALAISITLAAVPVDGIWSLVSGTLTLLGSTVFIGGIVSMVVRLFGRTTLTMALGALCGMAALIAATQARQKKIDRWEAQVLIKLSGKSSRFAAAIDTGNRLREPISNLPVLIVEYRAISHMLPGCFKADRPRDGLPSGYRLTAFKTLGADGEMALFRPDELLVSYGDGWLMARDVWVGVYPGRIPGQYRALAPTVIGRIDVDNNKYSEGSGNKWSIPRSRQ